MSDLTAEDIRLIALGHAALEIAGAGSFSQPGWPLVDVDVLFAKQREVEDLAAIFREQGHCPRCGYKPGAR